jgi:hypothetical protein
MPDPVVTIHNHIPSQRYRCNDSLGVPRARDQAQPPSLGPFRPARIAADFNLHRVGIALSPLRERGAPEQAARQSALTAIGSSFAMAHKRRRPSFLRVRKLRESFTTSSSAGTRVVLSPSMPCDGCVTPAWLFRKSIGMEPSSSLPARGAQIDPLFAGRKLSSAAAPYRKRPWRLLAKSCGSN